MKKGNNFIIIVLVGLILLFGGIYIYLNFFSDYGKYKEVNNFNELVTVFENKFSKYKIENISKLEKNITNLNNLTNKEKVEIAYYGIRDKALDSYTNGIDAKLMDDYLNGLFGNDFKWKKDSILCNLGDELYLYNEDTNKYVYNEEHLGHGATVVESYFSKIISIQESGNLYKVKEVRLWMKYSETGPTSFEDAYDTYNNAVNETNPLFRYNMTGVIPDGEEYYYFLKSEIENNFDQYKDKMATYTYNFEKVNGEYYLVGLSFEDR